MAEWTTAYINDLPDSSFAYIEPGGEKDSEGKTTPRSLRHLPYKDAQGNVDMAHCRNALARLDQVDAIPASMRERIRSMLEKAMGGGDMPMKAEQLTGSKWRVLAIPFGGPFAGKDFDGEFFDRETDVKPHWFKARPVIFHHGQDGGAKDEDYGEQELDEKPDEDGWWGTVWLNRSARYWAQVDALLRAGKMFGSSGAIAHLVRKDHKTGHIEVWPHAEQTLTLTPANPYARITASKAVWDLDALAGDLRADLPNDGEPSGDLSNGGDAAAIERLASALADLERLLKRI